MLQGNQGKLKRFEVVPHHEMLKQFEFEHNNAKFLTEALSYLVYVFSDWWKLYPFLFTGIEWIVDNHFTI